MRRLLPPDPTMRTLSEDGCSVPAWPVAHAASDKANMTTMRRMKPPLATRSRAFGWTQRVGRRCLRSRRRLRALGWPLHVREQFLSHFRIADLPDHPIREVVVNVDEHQDEHRRRLSWLFTEHVGHRA